MHHVDYDQESIDSGLLLRRDHSVVLFLVRGWNLLGFRIHQTCNSTLVLLTTLWVPMYLLPLRMTPSIGERVLGWGSP